MMSYDGSNLRNLSWLLHMVHIGHEFCNQDQFRTEKKSPFGRLTHLIL